MTLILVFMVCDFLISLFNLVVWNLLAKIGYGCWWISTICKFMMVLETKIGFFFFLNLKFSLLNYVSLK